MLHFFKNPNSHLKIPVVSSDFYETVGFGSLILEKTVARCVSTNVLRARYMPELEPS